MACSVRNAVCAWPRGKAEAWESLRSRINYDVASELLMLSKIEWLKQFQKPAFCDSSTVSHADSALHALQSAVVSKTAEAKTTTIRGPGHKKHGVTVRVLPTSPRQLVRPCHASTATEYCRSPGTRGTIQLSQTLKVRESSAQAPSARTQSTDAGKGAK